MVSKHNSVVQEIVFEKFSPGCIIIFRWVEGKVLFLVSHNHLCVVCVSRLVWLYLWSVLFYRVTLGPRSQEQLGALRRHLIQFSPQYQTGSLAEHSTPPILTKPLMMFVFWILILMYELLADRTYMRLPCKRFWLNRDKNWNFFVAQGALKYTCSHNTNQDLMLSDKKGNTAVQQWWFCSDQQS